MPLDPASTTAAVVAPWPRDIQDGGRERHPLHWRHAYSGENPSGTVRSVRQRTWSGLTAVAKEMDFRGAFEVDRSAPYHRLIVILEEVGDRIHGQERPGLSGSPADASNRLYLVPRDVPFWTFSKSLRYVRHLSLQFDICELAALSDVNDEAMLPRSPRLGFSDARLLALARVFEAECDRPGPSDPLLGNSLSLGLLSMLRGLDHAPRATPRGGLTPRQLRMVTDYLETRLHERIDPLELAMTAGLSPSHFHHAFRASTGRPPHRWVTDQRIRRAQELMLAADRSLGDIAFQTGFADQPHFTRVFAKVVGVTPHAWRRERLS